MFAVIISEKGGAERRESFDRTEINVGRVQGNDLMLPKGNVSKRHARLLFRDGRFIVTDLKSTNGTYVNGRKIAQATIVREGDKIYIGDFVLRIETAQATSQSAGLKEADEVGAVMVEGSAPPPAQPAVHAPATSSGIPVAALLGGVAPPPVAIPAPPPPPSVGPAPSAGPPSSQSQPSSVDRPDRPRAPRIAPSSVDRHEVISHFPLEQDPDDSAHYPVPGPPRVPSAPKSQNPARPSIVPEPGRSVMPRPIRGLEDSAITPGPQAMPFPPMGHISPLASPMPPAIRAPSIPMPADSRPAPPPFPPTMPPDRQTSPSAGLLAKLPPGLSPSEPPVPGMFPPPLSRRTLAPGAGEGEASARLRNSSPEIEIDPVRMATRRAALAALIERATQTIDPAALASEPADAALSSAVDQALAGARGPEDDDALLADARRELLEHGPLTPLFDDEDVTEIQVMRHDYVVAMQGRRAVPSELGFTSEAAVGRALRRLCVLGGKPLAEGEVFVERRLPRGARLFAVLPGAGVDGGHMLVIRKPQRADLTLEDLVRSGTISRAMAGLFSQCVGARANILVTGAVGAGATSLLGALAGAGSTEDRVVVLQEDDELIFNQPHTISILLGDTTEERARAVQAATRVRPDRLVVGAFAGPVAAELVDAMGDGVDGVLAAARAPTLRQAVLRLTADLAATKPGITPDVAREWLTSVFDLVIEIGRLRDGRHRVLRVSELGVEGSKVAIRDIFTFVVERTAAGGAVEGTFHPTGAVPGIIEDLGARGVHVDSSIFKRKPEMLSPTPR